MTGSVGTLGDFDGLAAEEPFPGVQRRSFDSDGATVTQYRFDPRARFPLHRHPQEQITIVQRGDIRLTVGDEVHEQSAGAWSVIAGDIEHGIEAGAGGAEFIAVVVPRRGSSDAYTLVEDGG